MQIRSGRFKTSGLTSLAQDVLNEDNHVFTTRH